MFKHICLFFVPQKVKRAFTPMLTIELKETPENKLNRKSQCTTMYKNNSGFIAKMKISKYKKGQCLTEKLVLVNPLLFLY